MDVDDQLTAPPLHGRDVAPRRSGCCSSSEAMIRLSVVTARCSSRIFFAAGKELGDLRLGLRAEFDRNDLQLAAALPGFDLRGSDHAIAAPPAAASWRC